MAERTTDNQERPKLKRGCSGAHDRCYAVFSDCPYCDYDWPLRYENGRFAPHATTQPDPPKETNNAC